MNRHYTRRVTYEHEAVFDFVNLSSFLGSYAAHHDDTLPRSWADLVQEGFIADHPKFAAQYMRYFEGNAVYSPERLRWIPSARLGDYAQTEDGPVSRTTGQRVRLVWLEGVAPDVYQENVYHNLILKVWAEQEREAAATQIGKRTRRGHH